MIKDMGDKSVITSLLSWSGITILHFLALSHRFTFD